MCRLCETRLLNDRIARQLKNIDEGGAVSLPAIRDVLTAAHEELQRSVATQTLVLGMLYGELVAEGDGIDLQGVTRREGRH